MRAHEPGRRGRCRGRGNAAPRRTRPGPDLASRWPRRGRRPTAVRPAEAVDASRRLDSSTVRGRRRGWPRGRRSHRGSPGVAAAPQVLLRSERLARLAADAGTAAAGLVRVGGVVDGEQWTLPPGVMTELSKVVEASLAASSKTAYRSDWRRFTGWAGAGGFPALPAPPVVVAAYVTAAAAEQTPSGRFRYAPSTLTRWVSSINQFHTAAGLEAPGRTEVVRRALSGIRRIRATPPSRRAPLLLEDIRDPAGLAEPAGRRLAGRGRGPAGRGAAADGVRRGVPPLRARRPDRRPM